MREQRLFQESLLEERERSIASTQQGYDVDVEDELVQDLLVQTKQQQHPLRRAAVDQEPVVNNERHGKLERD